MATPEAPKKPDALSDAAFRELQKLAGEHPERVVAELKYNSNNFIVVSVPHLVAAIASTTSTPFHEVACFKEQEHVWAHMSLGMDVMEAKSKPFWPDGVTVFSGFGDVQLPSPGAVIKLGSIQQKAFAMATKAKAEAYVGVRPSCCSVF